MIVSHNQKFGVCLIQGINDHKVESLYSKYRIGDDVDVRLVPNTNEVKGDLQLMTLK